MTWRLVGQVYSYWRRATKNIWQCSVCGRRAWTLGGFPPKCDHGEGGEDG